MKKDRYYSEKEKGEELGVRVCVSGWGEEAYHEDGLLMVPH